jgi:hypothetical protein
MIMFPAEKKVRPPRSGAAPLPVYLTKETLPREKQSLLRHHLALHKRINKMAISIK